MINFLKAEVKKAQDNNEDAVSLGRIKKRLNCLEANLIEFLVGGITISDRDALKDLVEDATKNCASAATNGVGYAANFQGLKASYELYTNLSKENTNCDQISKDLTKMIFDAYFNATRILYSTVATDEEAKDLIKLSLEQNHPINIGEYIKDKNTESSNVLCSIRTDIEVLNAISKIITIMATSNQCLLQAPSINGY
jgi:predicted house-cleaning noncanonical NTP pyrophosphatase (MazG superfamily)